MQGRHPAKKLAQMKRLHVGPGLHLQIENRALSKKFANRAFQYTVKQIYKQRLLVHCEINWQKENVGTLSNKFEKENVSTLSKKFANRNCQYTVNEIYKMRMLVHCQINLHIENVSTVHCQKKCSHKKKKFCSSDFCFQFCYSMTHQDTMKTVQCTLHSKYTVHTVV